MGSFHKEVPESNYLSIIKLADEQNVYKWLAGLSSILYISNPNISARIRGNIERSCGF